MSKRVESPSSILTYKQCPRRYYYQYIEKLPTIENIHQVRGNIIHQTLQDFFKINPETLTNTYEFLLKTVVFDMFKQNWLKDKERLLSLKLEQDQLNFYYEETNIMLENWFYGFLEKLNNQLKTKTIKDAFKSLTPRTELEFVSMQHKVRGFIDAIYQIENETTIVDYKTSKKPYITEEYKLQLAIYALLYTEKYGKPPKRVGINFLKFDEKFIDVDQQLLELAKKECKVMHANTDSESKEKYPKIHPTCEGPLCIYSTGKCDFYDICKKDD